MFNRSHKKGRLISPVEAGAVLDSCVRISMNPNDLADLDQQSQRSINTLVYMTRAAIVIHWLRLYQENKSCSDRANLILEEFERLTFSPMPIEGRGFLLDRLQKLITLVIKLQELVDNRPSSTMEASRQMMSWSRDWLLLGLPNDDKVSHLCFAHGGPMMVWIHGSMGMLGKTVEALMLGKDIAAEEKG